MRVNKKNPLPEEEDIAGGLCILLSGSADTVGWNDLVLFSFLKTYTFLSIRYIFRNSTNRQVFIQKKITGIIKPNSKELNPVNQGPRWVRIMKDIVVKNLVAHSLLKKCYILCVCADFRITVNIFWFPVTKEKGKRHEILELWSSINLAQHRKCCSFFIITPP